MLSRALELVPPDSHQAGQLLPRYVRVLGWQNADYEGAQQAFLQGLTIAQRESDADLEIAMLAEAGLVDFYHLRFQDSLEKHLRAIEIARQSDDLESAMLAHRFAATSLLVMGDVKGARSYVAGALAAVDKLRARDWTAITLSFACEMARLEGEWEMARNFSERGLLLEPQFPLLLGNRALLEYEVGEFGQGDIYLKQLVESIGLAPPGPNWESSVPAMVIPTVGRMTAIVDQFDISEATAETVLSSPSATPLHAASANAGLGLIAVCRGEVALAKEQYEALEPVRGLMAPWMWTSGDRLLGLLSHTMGNPEQAADHFNDALAFCRKAGYRPELAWTCCDYADTLLQRDNPGDRGRAMSLLDESLAISSELGMRPLMERVLSRREILKA